MTFLSISDPLLHPEVESLNRFLGLIVQTVQRENAFDGFIANKFCLGALPLSPNAKFQVF